MSDKPDVKKNSCLLWKISSSKELSGAEALYAPTGACVSRECEPATSSMLTPSGFQPSPAHRMNVLQFCFWPTNKSLITLASTNQEDSVKKKVRTTAHLSPKGRAYKAYDNTAFLHGPDARSIRILSEFHEPLARFRRNGVRDTVVFYGSARIQPPEVAKKKYAVLKAKAKKKSHPAVIREMEYAGVELEMSQYYAAADRLAFLLTRWSNQLEDGHRFIVCSGGGPGIMEAANRGARRAKGAAIGLNISLPFEQFPNPYITPELNFEFHYFFMRKFWFAYLAKALVVFPGGFGTMDELFELLTLVQTRKIQKPLAILIYGRAYWDKLIDFEAMVRYHMISPEDLDLFHFADAPEDAFEFLRERLTRDYL